MATVYLLTPEENLNFDLMRLSPPRRIIRKKGIYVYSPGGGRRKPALFCLKNLPSNTGYTARMVITYLDESENKMALDLSQQKVVTTTLKQNPVLTGLPQVASQPFAGSL